MTKDWISDGITRMRNALMLNKPTVEVRGTKTMLHVLDIMKLEGFIKGYEMVEVKDNCATSLKQACVVKLLYREAQPVIRGLKRVSKPSLRVYVSSDELRSYLKKFSMPIVSTSKGMLSGKKAIEQNLGGEFICEVR